MERHLYGEDKKKDNFLDWRRFKWTKRRKIEQT